MAPGNNGRHPNHTGTIPKTKVRNNCNVPQEAVTPTRRDMTSNLVSTSLDWVPVSEYNTRSNNSQSRKPTNNTSDQELTDIDNAISFESGFGRFVPVRPQPRALPLNAQNRDNISEHQDDGAGSSMSGHSLHPYAHQMQNGLIPHSNHAAAAVMIVNPTTPNAVAGNISQPFNAPNQNRNNLTRNLNPARNNWEGGAHASNNNNSTPSTSHSRTATKTVNLMNNMYEQGQGGSFNNLNENNVHRESARALGEAIVAACPDAVAVERRLGQIREYIRVTSSLVDTMRNSEDEEVVTRPASVQSNGSGYSDNDLWQNEIKNKMEMSQMRLAALKQQQKRLLKYQEETKQQLDEISRERERSQEIQPSTSHDNYSGMQNQTHGSNYNHPNRMYAANQIGVATTLPHSSEPLPAHAHPRASTDTELPHSHGHAQHERLSHRDGNNASGEEAAGGAHSEGDEDDADVELSARGQMLQLKLRELHMKKQHMESMVSEFQKLQMATRIGSAHNTYSSSGEDSGDEEPARKCNKPGGHIKNEDPFKLMEIKAIKTALQKTKDLMRSVETFESEQPSGAHDDTFREISSHSNIHDNKSEGGGSMGGWSNDGSVCRVRNTLPQRHKFTNEQHSQQHHSQQLQQLQQEIHQQQMQHQQLAQQLPQHHQQQIQQNQQQHLQQSHQQQLQHQMHQQHPQQQQQSHEAKIASLQELAQELRMETEKIMNERARIKDVLSNKEGSRKQKKVNEEVRSGASGAPGPVERRQMQLRAVLAEKQRELEALLNKEVLVSTQGAQNKPESQTASVVNQSYNSEQDEPDSRSEHILMESQNSREIENFRGNGDNAHGSRAMAALPTNIGSSYCSDSDSASRNKSNQRNRPRRRQAQERLSEDRATPQSNNTNQNIRHEARPELMSNVNMVPPIAQNPPENSGAMPYPHLPPPCWNTKSNQDMRTNQFTQNSHSQTMERLLGTPQMSFPPSVPFNMMMPYAMVGGCGCGCGFWGAWCWQQLVMQQREIHQLRDQLNHLEERWRTETASHTLNNQVPPGNRANNYWDNFRSYSRQNLLSANNKANAEGQSGAGGAGGAAHNSHPLASRSHNSLHRAAPVPVPSPAPASPKRNSNATSSTHNVATATGTQTAAQRALTNWQEARPRGGRNLAYERSLSFSSAPDVLNLNQNNEDASCSSPNLKINRQEPNSNSFRNLNIAHPIPEIIQSHHSNDLNASNGKKKSSSKLPAKNSTDRRNCALDYSQTSNINIAGASEAPNPNLASTSREVHDKATSKLFDLLKENVYSEVTALIGVNESHPDFLIQLFRELQLISSDALRQRVLQSIRHILSQYSSVVECQNREQLDDRGPEAVSSASAEASSYNDSDSLSTQNANNSGAMPVDHPIVHFLLIKSDEYCTTEFLEAFASHILSGRNPHGRYSQQAKRRLLEFLAKYEGMRVGQISSDVIENLPVYLSSSTEHEQCQQTASDHPEPSILQDVAGSLNLFSSSDSQLHQINGCPYDLWPGHVHMDIEPVDLNEDSARSSRDEKVDLINCTEMHNGDLAEADQTCPTDMEDANALDEAGANAEALPDVVDTEEVTPTEAEAEWLGLDRVPTRLHMEDTSEKQKD